MGHLQELTHICQRRANMGHLPKRAAEQQFVGRLGARHSRNKIQRSCISVHPPEP
jgi:hypothetical protein